MFFIVHALVFLLCAALVVSLLSSAIHTVVLPRGVPDRLTRVVFWVMRGIFNFVARRARSYRDRDAIMALYSPVSLIVLPIVWLAIASAGYTGMFWAVGVDSLVAAYTLSGSSLLTLGFAPAKDLPTTVLAFSAAAIGLILIALLISYLPTMYGTFTRREAAVTMLSVRAGTPPSAAELFQRTQRIQNWNRLPDLWLAWEVWFVELEETHTTLPPLAFFRSPQAGRSWITAAGTVLDSAALALSTLDLPPEPQAAICLRAGFLALHRVADLFNLPYNAAPTPDDLISITRDEFDALCDELAAAGIALKPDRDQAWRDFRGWRVNYDVALLALAATIMAPYAPWSSDRGLVVPRPGPRQRTGQRPK